MPDIILIGGPHHRGSVKIYFTIGSFIDNLDMKAFKKFDGKVIISSE